MKFLKRNFISRLRSFTSDKEGGLEALTSTAEGSSRSFTSTAEGSLKGFTLVELLVVIALLAILFGVVYINLNPTARFAEARNTQRITAVNGLLSAMHQYLIENEGALPTGLSTGMAETQLGTATTGCTTAVGGACGTVAACLDLSTPLTKYLPAIPIDPTEAETGKTGYTVQVSTNGIITIRSCNAEADATIQASR